ncbi:MAG: signal peptidase II [Clostridia bacterium]|nr:signal peptidase II [Clostridia bacterium]
MNTSFRKARHTFWICTLVFLLDRVTKILAARLEKPVTLIPGVIGLNYTQNTGIAFGLFPGAPLLLGILSVLLMTGFLCLLSRLSLKTGSWVCVMLVLGGALSNALDRILLGRVPDMIEILAFRWGIFNVADTAVVIGFVLLGIRCLTHPEEWKKHHGNSGEDR